MEFSYVASKRKLRYKILFLILHFKRFKLKNSIIIFSEPRGGSTWLAEILQVIPNSVLNHGPLHAKNGVIPKDLYMGWTPEMEKSNLEQKYTALFGKIFSYKLYNKWTASYLGIKQLLGAKYVITKMVLANRLLPWVSLALNSELKIKPVYLLRHPIPTCISQLKTLKGLNKEKILKGEAEGSPSGKFCSSSDEEIKEEISISHFISSLRTPLERQVAYWCQSNCPNLNNSFRSSWITVYYEDLMLSPFDQSKQLFNQLGIKIEEDKLKNFPFSKPSNSNFLNTYCSNTKDQLEGFLQELTTEELERLQRIFNFFGLRVYSAFDAFPIPHS